MSIAKTLGVDDVDNPLMSAARAAWPQWVRDRPDLGVVDDLLELPAWLRASAPVDRDGPMRPLAALAATDSRAAATMVWLLIPGVKRLCAGLRDVADDIDGLVAGQLWVEICSHADPPSKCVAMTILRNVEHHIQAEFGIGRHAEQADRTLAMMWPCESIEANATSVLPANEPEAEHVVRVIMQRMYEDGEVGYPDIQTLSSAMGHADWLEKPLRGRAGLTSPEALEVLTWLDQKKARSMRRYVGILLDRVAEFARTHDIADLLAEFDRVNPDDDLSYMEWDLSLNPREAGAFARWREFDVEATRRHSETWDPETGRCAADPELCRACMVASNAA